MRKANFFERIIYWLKEMVTSKEKQIENNDELKREMCKKHYKRRLP